MLRELVVLLCAASIVSAEPLHPEDPAARNQLTYSTTPASTEVTSKATYEAHHVDQQQGKAASPHVITYQNVAAPPNAYLPTRLASYEVKPALVQNLGTIGPIAAKESANNNQQVVYTKVASPPQQVSVVGQYFPTPVTYATNAPVRPYYSVPVAAKTVKVESRAQSLHYAGHQVASAVTYASNAPPARPYYSVPVALKTVSIESPATVTAAPPVAYASYRVNSPVTYVNNVVAAKPYYSVPVAAKSVTVESQPQPQAVPVRTVVQPVTQYVSAPVVYAPNPAVKVVPSVPVASKTVAVESAPQYVTAPQLVRYAPVAIPKPAPLVYQATGVETHHPATQQFAVFTNTVVPTAATYKQEPVQVQPVPVPVQYHAAGAVQYQPVPVPVVHAKSFVEKVYAPVGSTPAPVGQEYVGYARAVSYSPASAVSRVTFNGLGVSYGW